MPDDVIGHAADEKAAHGSAAVTANDHEVNLLAAGGLHDRFSGVALPDEELDDHATASTALRDGLGGGLAKAPHLVNPARRGSASAGQRIDDTQDEEVGAQVVGEIEGKAGRRVGRGLEVGRQQDPPNGAA
jgi:hypothetical protein